MRQGYFSYASPLASERRGRRVNSHAPPPPSPPPTGLSVAGRCWGLRARTLVKPAETHRFICCVLFVGLALIHWLLPALWLAGCGWGWGGGGRLLRSIVSHADGFQTKQPPPSPRRSIWHSWLGWGQLRESSCRQMFAPPLWINTGRASAGVLRFILYMRWTTYGHAKP